MAEILESRSIPPFLIFASTTPSQILKIAKDKMDLSFLNRALSW